MSALDIEIRDGGIVAWFPCASDAVYLTEDEARDAGNQLLRVAEFLHVEKGFQRLEQGA